MNFMKTMSLLIAIFCIVLSINVNAKELSINSFISHFQDFKGNIITIDSSKKYAFILIEELFCSKCVHQIIKELQTKKPEMEIVFLKYINDINDNYSKRNRISFLQGKYLDSAKVLFYNDLAKINKSLDIEVTATPDLFLILKDSVIYLSHIEMFPNSRFDYKSIRKHFE